MAPTSIFFQQLAELATRSDGRFAYCWACCIKPLRNMDNGYPARCAMNGQKIQGRFIDLAVNATGEEQLDLIARAIKSDRKGREIKPRSARRGKK